MQYRQLGKTTLQVPVLSLGTMRLPIRRVNPDFSAAISLIRYALDCGITFFDVGTFYCHGHCETAFGQATGHLPCDRFIVSEKNSSHQNQNIGWLAQLQNSLTLLGRDRFDIYFIHYLTLEQWRSYFLNHGVIEAIQSARAEGLFRYLGFSSHDQPEHVRQLIDTGLFDAVILPYNLIQTDYEDVLQYASQQGLGVIVMNPLAGGTLGRTQLYLEDFAQHFNDQTLAELALNFVLSQPFVHSVLSGMESPEIIDRNIATVDKPRLTADQLKNLRGSISQEKRKAFVACTGCGYCLPCTQGIDIPAVIQIWNQFSLLQGKQIYSRDYTLLSTPAECCIQCGACEEKCPQRIPIVTIMEEVGKRFQSTR